MAGLISGQIDISYGGATGVLPTVGRGVDLKFIATLSSRVKEIAGQARLTEFIVLCRLSSLRA
jgi:hypothetical protein